MSHDALRDQIAAALAKRDMRAFKSMLTNPNYQSGSNVRFKDWTVRLAGLDEAATKDVLGQLQAELQGTPLFPLASKIGGRVSSDMQFQAL